MSLRIFIIRLGCVLQLSQITVILNKIEFYFSLLYEFWVLPLQHQCGDSINISDPGSLLLFLLLSSMSDFHPQVCLVVQDRCQSSHQHSHFGHEDKEIGAGQKVCAPTLNQPSSKLFQKPHSFHFIPYLFLYKKMLPRISRFCYSERREE